VNFFFKIAILLFHNDSYLLLTFHLEDTKKYIFVCTFWDDIIFIPFHSWEKCGMRADDMLKAFPGGNQTPH
jgi:hypothetical protein